MNNKIIKLTTIQKLPSIPENWNYENSIFYIKPKVSNWKNETTEIAQELYIANQILSSPGKRTDLVSHETRLPTFREYCREIEIPRPTAYRWISMVFGQQKELPIPETPPLPPGTYNVIYADPPWHYDNSGITGAAQNHYPTMTTEKICALKVPSAENAVLFLWVTNPFLKEGIQVCETWGFEYKTNMVWIKERAGQGFYIKGQHELLFIAVKGNFRPDDSLYIRSVINEPKGEHSQKPIKFYEIIETLYPNQRYLEMFARSKRNGWTSWGNETI